MSPKKTIALVVIAVAVLFFYLKDKEKVAEQKKAEEQKKQFVTVESEDVMALSIERDGNVIRAERDGDDWKITDPVEWPGEKYAWQTIADNLTSAKIERKFPDEGETLDEKLLEDWGLKPPHLTLKATIREDSKELTFKFGNHPPGTRSSVYAQSSEKEGQAFIIPQAVVFSSSKELRDLRDRKMVHARFDHDDLKEVEVRNNDLHFVAKVDGNGRWILTSHGNVRADRGQIRLYVDKLNSDAKDILDHVPVEKVKEYGLAEDQLASASMYRVVMGSEGITKTFYVGKWSDEHQAHIGKREGKDSLFVIKDSFFTGVKKKVQDLRPKKAIPLETYNTDVISATSHGEPLYVLRKKDFKWRMEIPHDATAERDAVDDLIRAFNDHKIKSYLTSATDDAALGLENPQLIFKVEGDDKSETVLFGNRDGTGNVYCAWVGYPDRFLIEQEILDTLLVDPLDLLIPAERDRLAPKEEEKEEVLDLTEDATAEVKAATGQTGTQPPKEDTSAPPRSATNEAAALKEEKKENPSGEPEKPETVEEPSHQEASSESVDTGSEKPASAGEVSSATTPSGQSGGADSGEKSESEKKPAKQEKQ